MIGTLLLVVTWVPLVAFHLSAMTLKPDASGTLLVVFPPTRSKLAVFDSVRTADGALMRRVGSLGNVWIAFSDTQGFVRRLQNQGAWRAFSTDLLDLTTVFDCMSPASPWSKS